MGNTENSVSTLGLLWFHETDTLGFKIKEQSGSKKYTKRVILSEIAKIYDPLNLLAPVTVYNKILMQRIWQTKTSWDENLTVEIAKKWEKVRSQLHLLSGMRIERWLKTEGNDRVELIGFSDASTKAYAAVIYMRVWKQGIPHISLVTSKTRVAPMKTVTLPKL